MANPPRTRPRGVFASYSIPRSRSPARLRAQISTSPQPRLGPPPNAGAGVPAELEGPHMQARGSEVHPHGRACVVLSLWRH